MYSIRKKMTQQEIQQTLSDMGNVIKVLEANKNGSLVTTTFGVEQTPTRLNTRYGNTGSPR
jgi:hypothetical protein